MAKYLICKSQVGEGCDYTIGCGMTYEIEEFDGDILQAKAHFAQKVAYPDGPEEGFALDGDRDLEEVLIVPIIGEPHYIDLEALRKEHYNAEALKNLKNEEKREREQLARLKEKYGEDDHD